MWNWVEVAGFCERQCRRHLGAGQDAQDAAQEALLRAWRMRHQCLSPSQPWGWIARICQRECARLAMRRQDAELVAEPAAEGPSWEDRIVERDAARSAVAGLPAIDRELIELRYQHDQTYARIAELLDLPVGTVKVRLHRARLRLRDALAK